MLEIFEIYFSEWKSNKLYLFNLILAIYMQIDEMDVGMFMRGDCSKTTFWIYDGIGAYNNAFIKKLDTICRWKVNEILQTYEYFTTDIIKSGENQIGLYKFLFEILYMKVLSKLMERLKRYRV